MTQSAHQSVSKMDTSHFPAKRMLALMGLCNFSIMSCYVCLMLYLPVIMENIVQNQNIAQPAYWVQARVSNLKSVMDGFVALLTFFIVPSLGSLSDRFGRKAVLLGSMSGIALGMMQVAAANYFQLLPMVFTGQLCIFTLASWQASSSAYVSDLASDQPKTVRPVFFGINMAGAMIALLATSPVLGTVGAKHLTLTIVALSGLLVFASIVLACFLKEHPSLSAKGLKDQPHTANPFSVVKRVCTAEGSKRIIVIIVITFFTNFAMTDIIKTGYIYTQNRYGWDTAEFGYLTAGVGVSTIVSQVLLMGVISRFVPEQHIMTFCYFYSAAVHTLLGLSTTGKIFVITKLSEGPALCAMPAALSLTTQLSPPDQVGAVMSAIQVVNALGSFVGSLVIENYFAWCLMSPHAKLFTPRFIGTVYMFCGFIFFCTGLIAAFLCVKLRQDRKGRTRASSVSVRVEAGASTDETKPLIVN